MTTTFAPAPRSAAASSTARADAARASGLRPRALTRDGLVDLAVLVVLLGVVAVGFRPVWGSWGFVLAAGGGAVLGLGIAWVAAARRWSTLTVAGAVVLAYLLGGGPLALSRTTVAGVVPTAETARGLLRGAVLSWKSFVTTAPPLASFPDLALVPFLVLLLVAVVAGTVAWRAKHAAWALVPVLVGLVATVLLGTVETAYPLVQGVVLATVGLLWSAWRVTQARTGDSELQSDASADARRRLARHRAVGGLAVLAGAAAVAVAVAPVVLPDSGRTVLRESVEPPPDLHQYPTPLVSFRHYAKDLKDDKVLTVSGLTSGERVRIATLDSYDGIVYAASSDEDGSGVFVRAGQHVASDAQGTASTLTVKVDDGYQGPWVPDAGSVTGIRYLGGDAATLAKGTFYNATTGTVLNTARLSPGDSYTVDVVTTAPTTLADLKGVPVEQVAVPDPSGVPAAVAAKADQFIGGATDPRQQLLRLHDALVKSGLYSSGLSTQMPSRPGHSAERIDTLLASDTMVGDDEQFAVAYALMARSLGIPARVVMGVYPDAGAWKEGTPFVATGANVHAWVEVPFEGKGWVPIDVVPDEDNKVQPQPRSAQVPKPPVLQDPDPPAEPNQADTGATKDEKKKQDKNTADGFDWGHAAAVTAAVVIPLGLLALPFLVLLALKSRRRARRRNTGHPAHRISGGWREVLDTAVDLGHDVPSGATRRETAELLTEAYPKVATTALAEHADRTVFGGTDPEHDEVTAYWTGVDAAVREMRSSVPWRRRLASRFSVRSLRRSRRAATTRRRPRTPEGDQR
ncbi:transglutaminase-like domain-containing protein [Luteimicrobium subarcticum]|uniref:Transglutaminase superfamily protein n=1 Tax=Luteimicrobium subarcticum TaxID=620910 RepID=A0A2M8WVN2_9MICO|nr:transglutaminase-like domain-containing protein [Luteimicrobium subarcticum]PJI94987.1 transglutaminase superfamily protein [Luteimicrobium subarcticum]